LESPEIGVAALGFLVKLLLIMEISDLDCWFHDDIMGDEGKWWLNENQASIFQNFME
jgi:hypothetical protein